LQSIRISEYKPNKYLGFSAQKDEFQDQEKASYTAFSMLHRFLPNEQRDVRT